ncbi:ABC transporter ATP-binding protein [Candidatus Saccharibacteria bacterium]|nr:ABC transporter ATP-binding protein [Candidatus Saccharibacteria bacterium]
MNSEENKSSNELIELVDVCRSYGYGDAESFALKNFSMTVKRGEFIMIMGPSGCGKTTLLNVLGLLDKPTAGTYRLNGKKVSGFSARGKSRIRAKNIGFIFQDFNLIPNLTVIENVALPLVYSGASKTHRLIQASDTLQRFHLGEREYFFPSQLSGGQKQRVAIARSLVSKPEIILADEPTGSLDSRSSHIVMEELRRIHSEGNTIIMVTHNPNLTTYATRVIHMLDGGIDEDIKTVSDEDLPVPIHDRIERDDNDENEPEQFIERDLKLEADTDSFEARSDLASKRISDPDELGSGLSLEDIERAKEKKRRAAERAKKAAERAKKAKKKLPPKPKKPFPMPESAISSDRDVKIQEIPSIEELAKEKK